MNPKAGRVETLTMRRSTYDNSESFKEGVGTVAGASDQLNAFLVEIEGENEQIDFTLGKIEQ